MSPQQFETQLGTDAQTPVIVKTSSDSQDAQDLRARKDAVLLAFGRRIASHPRIPQLIRDAVSIVAETLDVDLGGIVELGEQDEAIRLAISPVGDSEDEPVSFEYSHDPFESMVGYAIDSGLTVVSNDLNSETRFCDKPLIEQGVVSAVMIPLVQRHQAIGAVGLYCTSKRDFSSEDTLFAETICLLLTATIVRSRAETALKRQSKYGELIAETLDACIIELDRTGRMIRINRSAQEWGGYQLDELGNRPFWNVFVVPKELELVRGLFRTVLSDTSPPPFESWFKPKNGPEKRISWSLAVQHDDTGQIRSVIMMGIDITKQLQAEKKAEQAETALVTTREENAELRERLATSSVGQSKKTSNAPASMTAGSEMPFEGSSEDLQGQTARPAKRRAFPYMQRIAPIVEGRMPTEDEFHVVPFRDISSTGVSFLVTQEPTFKKVAIELGQGRHTTHLVAEVARIKRIEHENTTAYLVGCKFTGRVGG